MNAKAEEIRPMARGRWGAILGALAPQLQPAIGQGGRRHVPCPVHGGKDGFRVFKDVEETGASVCNTCGRHSDGFATLMWVNAWAFPAALKAVADYLQAGRYEVRPMVRPPMTAKVKPKDNEKARQALNRAWGESIAIQERDAEPARLYLARRGLSLRPPEALRFHPSLAYYDGDQRIGEFPALIAMVSGLEGNPVTIHRTYLTADGQKAPVASPRKLMRFPDDRRILGGAIRLTGGDGPVLAVAEGLETALAVQEGTELLVWSAVNAPLLENLVPPKGTRRVLVFADKDRPTRQHPKGHGQEAARQLVQRLWGMGIKASAIVPAGEIPPGQKSLDWLDVLKRDGKAGFPSLASVEERLALRRAV